MNYITKEKAKLYSPLALAYYGDVVYELLARRKALLEGNRSAGKMHNDVVKRVRSGYQARAFEMIEPMLSEQETEIFRRGRNANSHAPRSSDPADYRKATGLEALFGYLYLTGETERAEELFEVIYENKTSQVR